MILPSGKLNTLRTKRKHSRKSPYNRERNTRRCSCMRETFGEDKAGKRELKNRGHFVLAPLVILLLPQYSKYGGIYDDFPNSVWIGPCPI
jgi:hypothetical protein